MNNEVQELLLMQDMSNDLSGKFVIWLIYFGNDLYENLIPNMRHYRMPFVRESHTSGEWEIVRSHLSERPWSIVGRHLACQRGSRAALR